MLGEFTIPREERAARVVRLAAAIGVRELVYIATCNRVEVAFGIERPGPITQFRRVIFSELAGRQPEDGEAEHTLRIWHGEGAAEHILLVTAGLDSARVGEYEIAVQVREAVDGSRALGLVGSRLEPIFTEALKVAKRVRAVTEARAGTVSLSDIVLRHVFERVVRTRGCVALVGISTMTEQCARALVARGIPARIVNRTLAKAVALAQDIGASASALEAFQRSPGPVAVVVLASGSREPVLSRAQLERIVAQSGSGEAPLVIDLGVPPNVRPEDVAAASMPLVSMTMINEEAAADRKRALMEMSEARTIVDGTLSELRRRMTKHLVGPMIAQLRLRYQNTAAEGLERLFRRDLSGLGDTEREALRRWADTLARRCAHIPSVGLRDLVYHSGPGAVEAFFSTTAPKLAQEIREAADRSGVSTDAPGDDVA